MAVFRRLQAVRAVATKIETRDCLYLYQTSRSYCGEISNGNELKSWRTYLCPLRGHNALPWIHGDTLTLQSLTAVQLSFLLNNKRLLSTNVKARPQARQMKFEAYDATGTVVARDKTKECADPFCLTPKTTALPYLRKPQNPPKFQSFPSTTRFYSTQNAVNPSFPDTATHYDDLISAAAHEKDFDTIHYLLNKRARDQVYNTLNTFKFITNTDTSLSILDNLTQNLARLDNGFPRTSAFNALIARLCKLDQIVEAMRIVKFMAGGQYGLTNGSFYPILFALTKKKKMEEAWGVMKVMKKEGVSPDMTAFNYLLTAYCYIGDITGTIKVLKRMETAGLGADERTYDALVLGACRAGKVEGALAILRKMGDDKVHVLYSSYMHVINALLKSGYYAQALKFVKIYGGRDVSLDLDNFGTLAAKLIRLKRIGEAKLVVEEMEERGLVISDKLKRLLQN